MDSDPQPRHSLGLGTPQDTPRGSFLAPDRSSTSTPRQRESDAFLNHNKEDSAAVESTHLPAEARARPFWKRPIFIIAIVVLIVVILAVVLPVYFVVVKKNDSASTTGNAASGSGNTGDNDSGSSGPKTNPQSTFKTGGDGSTVTKDDGTTFTYKNSFGGYWVSDSANPFDNSARPNSWTPPLNQSWKWGEDRVYGVNLGGLFVIEPFIVPSLFEQNPGAVDEWTLSTILAQQGADHLQKTLEDHYNTFITEEDIAQIAGAGLNWIRLPIPFWAIEAWNNVGVDESGQTVAEPFLVRVCWQYVLRVIGWARKYGLRVNLDLHTIPGSQNGYNHSGKLGTINWLRGVMGLANAQRSLDYIRIIAEFVSQPEYKDVIPIFGVLNEPYLHNIGETQIQSFYLQTYEMVRSITGIGEGNGPTIVFHDGFAGAANWAGFLTGADRIVIDTHPYFAFNGQPNREPLNVSATGDNSQLGGKWPQQACDQWGATLNNSRSGFGPTVAGEFSNAINDCGLFVDGVNGQARYGSDCDYWENYGSWSDDTKKGLLNFALASMDALGDYFFWTWKIGTSTTTNTVRAPLWSYQLGLQEGWMPADPRQAVGKCASLGVDGSPFDGKYEPWMTGGVGAGTIAPSATSGLQWPPVSFTDIPAAQMDQIPQYTSTATASTLPPPTFTASVTASVGNGWFNAKDNAPVVTAIAGCAYPDAWDANGVQIPASGCLPAN